MNKIMIPINFHLARKNKKVQIYSKRNFSFREEAQKTGDIMNR